MADIFEWRAELGPVRERLWKLVDDTPSLDWLFLTKRPHLVSRVVPWNVTPWPSNVWLGTTVEDQKWAAKRIPHIAQSGAKTKFLSCEPLLGPLELTGWFRQRVIDWVIAGGESGSGARPSNPEWFRSIRNQCSRYRVAFHFKQWGEWAPVDRSAQESKPDGAPVSLARLGKKVSGRVLDGKTWDGLPHPVVG
jgi:protein gp37